MKAKSKRAAPCSVVSAASPSASAAPPRDPDQHRPPGAAAVGGQRHGPAGHPAPPAVAHGAGITDRPARAGQPAGGDRWPRDQRAAPTAATGAPIGGGAGAARVSAGQRRSGGVQRRGHACGDTVADLTGLGVATFSARPDL